MEPSHGSRLVSTVLPEIVVLDRSVLIPRATLPLISLSAIVAIVAGVGSPGT